MLRKLHDSFADFLHGIRLLHPDAHGSEAVVCMPTGAHRAIIRLLEVSSGRLQTGSVRNAEDPRKRFDIHVIVRQLSLLFTEMGGEKK